MAKFIFNCDDEECLPAAYYLIDTAKEFVKKMKSIDVDEQEINGNKKAVFEKILENMLVKYPKDTSAVLSKLWILEKGEKAPNTFKTMAVLFSNEVAIDFFTSALPSLLQLSKELSPMLISKK